ncbi:unnamed protein product [Ilex paraguariensis]|uniref:DUF642 domain-containing protein n=1 Tax=Ilex paraguariensis TaxID=185542 RepID=A0ABC8RL70_9AQUA
MALAMLLLSFLFMIMSMSSAANKTTPLLLSAETNTFPGWSFNGVVWYVTAGHNVSLPGNIGHGVQLGQGSKINQTFRANRNYMDYVLTFTLARGGEDCSNTNSTAVNVSSPERSKVFFFERQYGREMWGNHAC